MLRIKNLVHTKDLECELHLTSQEQSWKPEINKLVKIFHKKNKKEFFFWCFISERLYSNCALKMERLVMPGLKYYLFQTMINNGC